MSCKTGGGSTCSHFRANCPQTDSRLRWCPSAANGSLTRRRQLIPDSFPGELKLVDEIFRAVAEIRRRGTTVLLVEQRLNSADACWRRVNPHSRSSAIRSAAPGSPGGRAPRIQQIPSGTR
jgi:hypothetical protein